MKQELYTIRWSANEILKKDNKNNHAQDIVQIATKLIGDAKPVTEPRIPIEIGSDLYPPFANVMKEKMKTRGIYPVAQSPLGAIVHFTAGHDGAAKTIRGGISNGYTFWAIQRDGQLYCAHPYNEWGHHAGESAWTHVAKPLIGSVSDDLIGIEINAAGRLEKLKDGTYKSWFGKIYLENEVRYCDGSSPDQLAGYYHKYTPEQEETLIKTLLWLKQRNPDVFSFDKVLGHSEVAGFLGIKKWRKNDPSAALSLTMPAFRKLLEERYKQI